MVIARRVISLKPLEANLIANTLSLEALNIACETTIGMCEINATASSCSSAVAYIISAFISVMIFCKLSGHSSLHITHFAPSKSSLKEFSKPVFSVPAIGCVGIKLYLYCFLHTKDFSEETSATIVFSETISSILSNISKTLFIGEATNTILHSFKIL